MSNPMTAWIQRRMETQGSRQDKFEDRLAQTAIESQQLYDERHGPMLAHNFWQKDISKDNAANRYYCSQSALKGQVGGKSNSFEAADHYITLARAKREALLKEVAA